MRIFKYLIFFLVILLGGCFEEKQKTVSIEQAYKDGFEVIVVDNNDIASLHLEKAEQQIKQSQSAVFFIPSDKIGYIRSKLEKKVNSSGDFYVTVKTKMSGDKQVVNVSFHYSSSTYSYCYEVVDNKSVKPLWSGFRDLVKSKKTVYR